jgi:outer membrane protein assembly factor BamB
VSTERGIPHEWDLETQQNIKWAVPLGSYSYGGPVVAGGRVFIGTNNARELRPHSSGDKGCLLCLDAATGQLLWQATHDKLPTGPANDWPEQGVASTPYVDGDRVYYVSNRCELVCADARGFHDDENDGPYRDEKFTERHDADFVWILDLIGELGVYPHNLAACSPVGDAARVYVCTSNGVDDEHDKPPAPQAPSFIAVDKQTGRVVWKRSDPGADILHGQWSSPALGVIAGRPQVIFGGGDGWCYSYDPATGTPLWKFNLNPPDAVWKPGGTGTKSSIVAMPVIAGDRVYLPVGDDPEQCRGPGHLYAIDATMGRHFDPSPFQGGVGGGSESADVNRERRASTNGSGASEKGTHPLDITESGRVWHVGGADFGCTIASVVVADGLLYAADLAGYLSCFDAATGRRHWRHDMQAGVWASPCVIDGKVYLGNTDGEMVILRHGIEREELARIDLRHAIYTPPAVADGVLYVMTQRFLYAIEAADKKRQ